MTTMRLELVNVPVEDVDRALRYYRDQVGFDLDHDTRVSDTMRIVQLTPPGSACSIALSSGMIAMPPGSVEGLQLVVGDVVTLRETLIARGVAVTAVQHFGDDGLEDGFVPEQDAFASFHDPDGNEWTLQQRPSKETQTS